MPSETRMEDRVKLPGGSLPLTTAVEPQPTQGGSLRSGVLDDSTPERPRVRDDDTDLHRQNSHCSAFGGPTSVDLPEELQ